jgi:hypothetical protein
LVPEIVALLARVRAVELIWVARVPLPPTARVTLPSALLLLLMRNVPPLRLTAE